MIYFLAAIAIVAMICILLFNKYAATPETTALNKLDLTNTSSSRPVPKPHTDPSVKKYLAENNRLAAVAAKKATAVSADEAAQKLQDLLKQSLNEGSYRAGQYNLTMADKMRLLEDYENERDAVPDMSEDELEQKIVELEDQIMDLEDNYASVQADTEVTGDLTELHDMDNRYGDLEEELAKYKEQLANYGKRNDETAQLMQRIIKEVGLDDDSSPFGPNLDSYF